MIEKNCIEIMNKIISVIEIRDIIKIGIEIIFKTTLSIQV